MDFILPITMQFIVASPLIRAFGLCLFLPLEQKTKRVFLFAVLLAISFWNIPISGSALSASAVAPSMTAPTMCVEFIFGALLSMPAVLMYSTAILLGELIDGITGQSIARMMDPISHTETSTLGIFFQQTLRALLLVWGAGEVVVRSFAHSVQIVPIGSLTFAECVVQVEQVVRAMITLLGHFLVPITSLIVLVWVVDGIAMLIGKCFSGAQLSSELGVWRSTIVAMIILAVVVSVMPSPSRSKSQSDPQSFSLVSPSYLKRLLMSPWLVVHDSKKNGPQL